MTQRERLLRPGRHRVLVSVAMYVIACVLPAVPPFNAENPIRGYVCLISVNGPLVYVYGLPYWWANPSYFVAVIASLFQWPRIAAVFAIVAALLAMSYEMIAFYEGGISGVRKVLLPGCLMWIASIQTLACHELWRVWLGRKQRDYERDAGSADSIATRDAAR